MIHEIGVFVKRLSRIYTSSQAGTEAVASMDGLREFERRVVFEKTQAGRAYSAKNYSVRGSLSPWKRLFV